MIIQFENLEYGHWILEPILELSSGVAFETALSGWSMTIIHSREENELSVSVDLRHKLKCTRYTPPLRTRNQMKKSASTGASRMNAETLQPADYGQFVPTSNKVTS